MRISRADRSVVGQWWFTVDKLLLGAILCLIGIGLMVSLAATPAVALRKGLPAFYFVERQVVFAGLAVVVMLVISLLDARSVRRLALMIFAGAIAAMLAVLLVGDDINGARRWLRIAGFSVQPSEFAKPAFVVLVAWAFAESERRRDMPGLAIAVLLLGLFVSLLVAQPDIGQAFLVCLVWGALFFVSGRSLAWAGGLAAIGAAGLIAAYFTMSHVKARIDAFWHGGERAFSQTGQAFRAFIEGGFLGRGPAEGSIKNRLPDAHGDFVFAVIAEEYGAIACLALVILFGFIVIKALARTLGEPDLFSRYAITALGLIIGLQAFINMAVNVGLLPAKGMTLPFISAGGSSTLAVGVTCGMLLALTRRRRNRARLKMPGLAGKRRPMQPTGPRTS